METATTVVVDSMEVYYNAFCTCKHWWKAEGPHCVDCATVLIRVSRARTEADYLMAFTA